MICFIDYLVIVVMVALFVKFIRTLAEKWGILGWLQAHAPNDFLYKLFSCEFCQSWWLGLAISIVLGVLIDWRLIFVPFFSSNIR